MLYVWNLYSDMSIISQYKWKKWWTGVHSGLSEPTMTSEVCEEVFNLFNFQNYFSAPFLMTEIH